MGSQHVVYPGYTSMWMVELKTMIFWEFERRVLIYSIRHGALADSNQQVATWCVQDY